MIGASFGNYASSGVGGFTGLLDDYPNAAAAYSLRLLKSDYTGALVEIRRSSDNAVKTFYADSNNELSLTSEDGSGTSLSSWITTDDGYVRTWYDQSGNGINFTQTSTSAQPSIITAGVINTKNSKNCITISKTTYLSIATSTALFNYLHNGTACSYISVNSFGTSSNPNDVFALIGNNNNSTTNIGYYLRYDDRTSLSRNNRLADYIPNGGGGVTSSCNTEVNDAITPNQNNLLFANIDADNTTAANRAMYYLNNGSVVQNNTQTSAPSVSSASADMFYGRLPSGGFAMIGTGAELIFWNTDQSANRTGIQTEINNFYSIY